MMFKCILITMFGWARLAVAGTELLGCEGKAPAHTYHFVAMFDLAARTVQHVVVTSVAKTPDKQMIYKHLDGDSVRIMPGEGEFGGIRMYYGAYLRDDRPYLSINTNDNGRVVIQFRGKGSFAFNPDREGTLQHAKCTRESVSPAEENGYARCLANFGECSASLDVLRSLGKGQ